MVFYANMDRVVTLVDDLDKALGHDTWAKCHFGRGRRHRGFVVLLQDSSGHVYLQKRKHKVFDGLWDLTSISHPYLVGNHQETLEEGALRSLKQEMGITKVELKNIGAFVYFAKDGEWCENEYCHIFVGKFDGKFKQNLKLVYDAKKVPYEQFMEDIFKNPKKYTPWARLTAKHLESKSEVKVKSELAGEMEKFLKTFEPYAAKYFEKKTSEVKKYDPLIVQFYRDLADFSAGGKRLRAFLVFLGYEIGSSRQARTINSILPICLAVEILHSFLLIHDDIADNSSLRRGKPTIHKRYEKLYGEHYGKSQAIILGDIACFEAFDLVNKSDLDEKVKIAVQGEIIKVLLETGYGEALDILNSQRKVKLRDVLKVTDLKTSRYSFVGPLTVGAVLGGVSGGKIQALEQYGLKIGLAYQMKDDILGVFGDEKKIGKSVLSDMREGKNTVLIEKTRERVSGGMIANWGNKKARKKELANVGEVIVDSGAFAWCEGEMKRLVLDAKKYIGAITSDSKLSRVFLEIADFVVEREK